MKKVLLSFLLLIAVLLPCRKSMAQTTLSPGDIVIVAINGDSDATNSLGRGFSFMTLVNLDAGTEIFFTDYGWSDLTNYFITNTSVADQFAKYIVPSGGLAAGTIVRFDSYHTTDFTVFYCYGSASLTTYLNVAGLTNGDEVLIFQANYDSSTHVFSSINFIYAASIVSTSLVSSGWATNVGTNGTDNSGAGSALPPGLTDDATALSFNQPATANDNCTYSGSASATTKTGWQDRIKSYSNWTFNDAPPIPTPPTGPFTVTGSSIVPTVTTQAVSNITVTTATGNGNITSLGSPNPTAYGVCWNTTGTPTISDSKVDKGAASVTGAFTASLTSLSAGTTYYVRAYATNSAGTSYGAEVSFTTSAATINVFEDFESYNYSHWANIASGSVWGSLKIFTQDMGIVFIHTASEGAGTGNGAKSISANAGSSSSWISFKHKDGLTFSLNSMALGNPNTTWGSQYLTVQGYRNGIKVKEKTDVLNWSTTTPITTNYTGWDDLDEIKILEPNMGSGDITYMAAYIDDISLTNIGSSSSAPTVTTQAVSSISTTTATGNGNITDLGVPNPTQYGVVWSTSTNPTVALTTKTAQGAIAATGAFTSSITGLSANTTYYVKAYATNTAGTSYGSEVSFTTLPTAATVTTQAVSNITATTATGNGNITDLGSPNPTAYGICWNTTGTPTISDSKVDKGTASATGAFTVSMTGLTAGTTYYVRAFATNSAGTSYGAEVSFTTSAGSTSWVKKVPNASAAFYGVAYGNNCFITSDFNNGQMYKSTDNGQTWSTPATVGGNIGYLAYGDNKFVAADNNLREYEFYSTDNGATWTEKQIGSGTGYSTGGITYGSSGFATVSNNSSYSNIFKSSDGITWTKMLSPSSITGILANIGYGNGTYVAVGHGGKIFTSTDASSWTSRTTPTTEYLMGVAYGNGIFVAVAGNGSVIKSSDNGLTWGVSVTYTASNGLNNIAFANGYFYAVGYGGLIIKSSDGVTWTTETSGVTSDLYGITYGNGYFVATGDAGVILVQTSTPVDVAPTVTTQEVSSITTTTATGNGNITDLGVPNPTQYGVVWSTSTNPTVVLTTKTAQGAIAATGAFTSSITGLSANTTYYVKAYATNTAGTSYGSEVSFTTLPIAPTVTTQEVSSITTTTATGNGNITNLGVPNPTQYGVVWSTSTNPTVALTTKTAQGAIAATGAFTSSITGLSANTTYYVKAYATNTAGTSYGSEVSFTTLPTAATVTTQAVSNIMATTATGNGNITDLGSPNPTAYGICWNTTGTPTTSDSKVDKGAASLTGAFTVSMSGLLAETTYYVRSYAINGAGTSYGNEVNFTTPTDCANPTSGGTISTNQTVCLGENSQSLTSSASPSGHTGTLEYKWQSSTTSSTTGFFDISDSNSETYSPGVLTESTWFRRLARVNCKSDWTGAAESNLIEITVNPLPVDQTVSPVLQSICSGNSATISITSSETGTNYYLRDNSDNTVVDGPKAGTGSSLNFSTGALTAGKTYNILAEKADGNSTALSLDGVDEYVSTANISNGSTWTYETLVKPNDISSIDWSGIITSNSGSGSGMWFQFSLNGSGKLRWESSGPDLSVDGIGPVINDNSWHHVAVTCDGTNIRFYTDGTLVNTTPFTGGTMNRPLHIMAERQPNQYIRGLVDQTMVWNYARSLSEIQTDKTTTLTGSEPGLMLYYTYEDGTGTTVTDIAGGDHNGTMMNMENEDWLTNANPTLSGDVCSIQLTSTATVSLSSVNTASLTSASGTDSQNACVNSPITEITYSTTGATGIGSATNLPSGIVATWASNKITISGTPSGAGTFNYSIPLTGGCGSVTAVGTITVNSVPAAPLAGSNSYTYDGTSKIATASVGSGEVIDWYANATGSTTSTAPSGTNVGSYSAYAEARNTTTGCVSASRTLISLEITKATLTVTADDQTKAFGSANPTLTFQYSGWQNDDDANDLTTKPTASTTVTEASPMGIYNDAITVSGGVDENYDFSYFAADFTVTKANQTITFEEFSGAKSYGDHSFVLTVTASSELPVSLVSSNTGAARISGNTVTIVGVGTTIITASQPGNENYNAASQVARELKVSAKVLKVYGAKAVSKIYDGKRDATIVGALLSGVVGSDLIVLENSNKGTFVKSSVGTGIQVSTAMTISGPKSENYYLIQPTDLKADITQLEVKVIANNVTKVCNMINQPLTYTFSPELIPNDMFTGELKREPGDDPGIYAINQGTLALSNNYRLIYQGANFVIMDNGPVWLTPVGDLDRTIEYTDIKGLEAAQTQNPSAFDVCNQTTANLIKIAGKFEMSNSCNLTGTYTNKWVATDSKGNSSTYIQTINIVDRTLPVVKELPSFQVLVAPGICETPISYPEFIISDACLDKVELISGLGKSGLFPIGTTKEIWKVTDKSGNFVYINFAITIKSYNVAPVIDQVTDLKVIKNTKEVEIPLSGIDPTSGCIQQEVISIAATADNNTLISEIITDYTKGQSNGKLILRIAENMIGESVIHVTLKDNGGTELNGSDTKTMNFRIKVEPVTGVSHLINDFDVKVYPNPCFGKVNIEVSGDVSSTLRIYSITGAEVYNKEISSDLSFDVDLSNNLAGIYFVEIRNAQHAITKKLILRK